MKLHADLLGWGSTMLPQFSSHYPAQFEWHRMEAIYQKIISEFDKGKVCNRNHYALLCFNKQTVRGSVSVIVCVIVCVIVSVIIGVVASVIVCVSVCVSVCVIVCVIVFFIVGVIVGVIVCVIVI